MIKDISFCSQMETILEKLRRENSMLKEKLKKKNANKSKQVKRWRENHREMHRAQKRESLKKGKKREEGNGRMQKKQLDKTRGSS